MPCAHRPYTRRGTGHWCRGYDWGPIRDTDPRYSVSTTHSSRGYGYRNCTDYVAWRLQKRGIPLAMFTGLGDGGDWAKAAAARGIVVNARPAVGSAAVQPGEPGHVAYVDSVRGATITVSEYNKKGDGTYDTRTGNARALGFARFVHF
ncbi:MAG TPA: CHAP domain-containing protein [Gaiellales bacterium]|nr:CHAP domain-containing protein [Gaiellales bacterium]